MAWVRAKRAYIRLTFSGADQNRLRVGEILILLGSESVEFLLEFFWGALPQFTVQLGMTAIVCAYRYVASWARPFRKCGTRAPVNFGSSHGSRCSRTL
jgi:hypothetical protein